MPTVPKVDRQVALEALPGVRLTAAKTPESEGAGIAEAQGQQGQALVGVGAKTAALGEDLLAKERENANAVIAIKANSDLTGWVDKRLNDPETGVLQQRGNNALGLPEKVTSEYNDYADSLAVKLSNPQQRLTFDRIRAERGLVLQNRVMEHTTSQIQQVRADTADSAVRNSQSFAIANADNPRVLKQELANQANTITTIGKQLGMSPESIKARLDASFSATHVGVIENLLAQEKTKAAQVYFEETRDHINGEQIARIEKALQEGTLRKQSQQVSDAILAGTYGVRADGSNKGEGYFGALKRPDGNFSSELSIGVEIDGKETEIPALVPTLTDKEVKTLLAQPTDAKIPDAIVEKATAYAKERIAAGKSPFAAAGEANTKLAASVDRAQPEKPAPPATLRQALDQVKAIDDPKLRDEVSARIEHEWNLKEAQRRDDDEAASKAGFTIIDKDAAHDWRKIPPTAWVSYSGATRSALMTYSERLSKGEAVETNWSTWDVLNRLATSQSTDDLQKFAQMNLVQYKGLLADGDMRHFLEVQGAVRKGDFNAAKVLTADDAVQKQIVDGNLVSLGINPNPAVPGKDGYDKQASDRVLAYRRAVRDAVAAREAVTKKKITEPEMQDIADSLMAQTAAAKEHWFSANEPARYAFESPDAGVTQAADVPASERTQIEAALKRAGLPVTDTAVVTLFNQHLQTVRGKTR